MAANRHRCLAAALLLTATSVCAAPAPSPAEAELPATSPTEYAGTVWQDAKNVFSAPTSWSENDWWKFGAATVAVVGTAATLDKPIRDAAQRNAGSGVEHFANNFEKFGAEYSFATIGAFYVGGLALHDDRSRLIAEDGLAASAISGTITFVLKEAVGRSRPVAGQGAYRFSPFSGNASFPSGHATQAFAIASVIAARYHDNVWIDLAAYGTATMVGVARIDHRAHFASDVVAGALIGNFVGRTVVGRRRRRKSANFDLEPVAAPGFTGLVGSLSF